MMRTNVYIDGFNLYYGCLRHKGRRWLNLSRFCTLSLPGLNINRIRYFTATVKATPQDPSKPVRQHTYIRALRTVPILSVHYGEFRIHRIRRPLASDPDSIVEVLDPEEKASDVNLASYLLMDAFNDEYEAAVVVSNDSDLATPIQMVCNDLSRQVGVLNPDISNRFGSQ